MRPAQAVTCEPARLVPDLCQPCLTRLVQVQPFCSQAHWLFCTTHLCLSIQLANLCLSIQLTNLCLSIQLTPLLLALLSVYTLLTLHTLLSPPDIAHILTPRTHAFLSRFAPALTGRHMGACQFRADSVRKNGMSAIPPALTPAKSSNPRGGRAA